MLINKSKVRAFALELVRTHRARQFKRVSPAFIDKIEASTKRAVVAAVQSHPSVGITLK